MLVCCLVAVRQKVLESNNSLQKRENPQTPPTPKETKKPVGASKAVGGDVRTAEEERVQDALRRALLKKTSKSCGGDVSAIGRYSPPSIAWKPQPTNAAKSTAPAKLQRDHLTQLMLPFAEASGVASQASTSTAATGPLQNKLCENLYRSLLNHDPRLSQAAAIASSNNSNIATKPNTNPPATPHNVIQCDSSDSDVIVVSSDDDM